MESVVRFTSNNVEPSPNADTFSLYVLNKGGEIIEQAKIQELREKKHPFFSSFVVNLKPLESAVEHMREYFQELYELINKHDVDTSYQPIHQTKTYNFGLDRYGRQEYIRGIIFHKVNMRKGSYFYVLQQSERKVRFLLYAINRVHHNSDCLGSSMILPKVTEQKKEMREKLFNFTIKQVHELKINNFVELILDDASYLF